MLACFHFGILISGAGLLKFSTSVYLLSVFWGGKDMYEVSRFLLQEGPFPFLMTSPEGQPLALENKP